MTNPKVALVTGAAGGVGRTLLDVLLKEGYRVVAEDIDPAVMSLENENVAALVGNSAETATAERAVALATRRFGGLDLLVNNAAVFLRKPIEDTTDDEWDRVMGVNVRGTFVHCREAVPALAARAGTIVNVASISGTVGFSGQVAYTSSKGAIVQLTRTLAVELGPRNIRVNAVAAGTIDTNFVANSPSSVVDEDEEDVKIIYPLGRILKASEVADSVSFLAGERASGITGSILTIDGGYTAR
jgi:NAD(P)-dependent dehydrogenase (short-subunit alcohol dehydrogenase family)